MLNFVFDSNSLSVGVMNLMGSILTTSLVY